MRYWFYIVIPVREEELGFNRAIFGPYTTYDKVLEASDKVGPGEIIDLPTRDPEEAAKMLDERYNIGGI
jgi:hypothetical protein